MKFIVEFQYKAPGATRPETRVQIDEVAFEGSESVPIPLVGDAVIYEYQGQMRPFKVKSRVFAYGNNSARPSTKVCSVLIVVTDITDEEMDSRMNVGSSFTINAGKE
jgi:hypothetical protein